jgi:hypothetical protein
MGYKSLITMKPGTRPLDRINPRPSLITMKYKMILIHSQVSIERLASREVF